MSEEFDVDYDEMTVEEMLELASEVMEEIKHAVVELAYAVIEHQEYTKYLAEETEKLAGLVNVEKMKSYPRSVLKGVNPFTV
jgi:hypothetical protein